MKARCHPRPAPPLSPLPPSTLPPQASPGPSPRPWSRDPGADQPRSGGGAAARAFKHISITPSRPARRGHLAVRSPRPRPHARTPAPPEMCSPPPPSLPCRSPISSPDILQQLISPHPIVSHLLRSYSITSHPTASHVP
ncbi:uncharacterized protein LOC134773897 [Penaeus indicus]|uniref:uncharacterized protein LOC134773897 n=1 Tax=Penaeus indicus TaxID=29960 RepID=UPI00300DA18D